jgi:hypothetical protein
MEVMPVTKYRCLVLDHDDTVVQTEKTIGLEGEAENGMRDGKYDKLIILFALLAVLFVADWMVYCYDRYQLR